MSLETGTLNCKIGDLEVTKGTFRKEFDLATWEVSPMCRGDRCLLRERCPYKSATESDKCKVHLKFMRSFYNMVFEEYEKRLDQQKMYQIGIHLAPLYSILCKLFIAEAALDVTYEFDKIGNIKANPLHREIRETIKSISALWKDLQVTGFAPSPQEAFDRAITIDANKAENGDPDYIERISAVGLKRDEPKVRPKLFTGD